LSVFLSNLTAVLSLTAGFLFNSFFALIIVYYLLISKEKIESFFNRFNTLDREHSTRLVNRAEEIINATVRGSIAIMISQFFLSLVGFLLFGIKSPFLFASLYGALSIIPGVGIALIWVPLAVTLLIAGNFFSCVAIIVWCLSTNFLMDNFVSPRIFAANAKLHPLLILFGVLGGIQLYGFLGIILGPTIIALSFVAVDMLSEIFNA
jgi:predicted PurR-regulated permease PerM